MFGMDDNRYRSAVDETAKPSYMNAKKTRDRCRRCHPHTSLVISSKQPLLRDAKHIMTHGRHQPAGGRPNSSNYNTINVHAFNRTQHSSRRRSTESIEPRLTNHYEGLLLCRDGEGRQQPRQVHLLTLGRKPQSSYPAPKSFATKSSESGKTKNKKCSVETSIPASPPKVHH